MTQWAQFTNKFLEDSLIKTCSESGDTPTDEQLIRIGEISKELFIRGAMTEELVERVRKLSV